MKKQTYDLEERLLEERMSIDVYLLKFAVNFSKQFSAYKGQGEGVKGGELYLRCASILAINTDA
jgi:hypothetical protein